MMSPGKNLAWALLPFSALFSSSIQQTCYYPNQNVAAGDVACNTGTDFTFCCGPGYACLENKVCEWTSAAGANPGISFDRGSCTDQSWKSDNCPQFCLGDDQDMAGGNAMAQCNTTAFICYSNQISANCTTGVNAFYLPGTNAITTIGVAGSGSTSSSASTSSTTSSSSSTSTSSSAAATTTTASTATSSTGSPTSGSATAAGASATNSSSAVTNTSSGLSGGAKAGIAVGVILGVAALAAIAFYFWRQSKRKNNAYRQPQYYDPSKQPYSDRRDHLSEAPSPAPAYKQTYNQRPQEMHVPPSELPGRGSYHPGPAYELDSR